MCRNEPDKSFQLKISKREFEKKPLSWLFQKGENYFKKKYETEIIFFELIFGIQVNNSKEISYYQDCLPVYFQIPSFYEEMIKLRINYEIDGKTELETVRVARNYKIIDLKKIIHHKIPKLENKDFHFEWKTEALNFDSKFLDYDIHTDAEIQITLSNPEEMHSKVCFLNKKSSFNSKVI